MLEVGNDIIEIKRIEEALTRYGQRFCDRICTPREQELAADRKDQTSFYAGRFAAKEAIAKALGCGIGQQLSWHDMEILYSAGGKPEVHFSSAIEQYWNPHPVVRLSISHCRTYATAVAIWVQ